MPNLRADHNHDDLSSTAHNDDDLSSTAHNDDHDEGSDPDYTKTPSFYLIDDGGEHAHRDTNFAGNHAGHNT